MRSSPPECGAKQISSKVSTSLIRGIVLTQPLSLVLICHRPNCDLVAACNWKCSAICSVGRRRICDGSQAYSNWREMQIELAQFSTVSLVRWIESSWWSASFRLLVMRYVRRKNKLKKMRTRRKYWLRPMLQGRTTITLFAELRHPRVRHFPSPFWESGIVGKIELLRQT